MAVIQGSNEIKVRDLEVDDVFIVGRILAKTSQRSRGLIAGIVSGKDRLNGEAGEAVKNRLYTETAMSVVNVLFGEAEADIKLFLAGMIDRSPEEFCKMPASTIPEIIRQLVQKEDTKDFFSQAWDWAVQSIGGSFLEPSMPSSTDTVGPTVSSTDSPGSVTLS